MHGNWSSPASVSPTCSHSTCSLVHVRLIFGLLQAVEELQAHVRGRLDCLAARTLHAQKALSAVRSMLFAQFMSSIAGRIAAMSGVRAAAARWCEVHPVSRPRRESRAHVQVRIPQRARHSTRFLHTLSAMQPSLLCTIGMCTYRRFLPLRRATFARTQRSVARLALRRTLHFRVFVVASTIEVDLRAQ